MGNPLFLLSDPPLCFPDINPPEHRIREGGSSWSIGICRVRTSHKDDRKGRWGWGPFVGPWPWEHGCHSECSDCESLGVCVSFSFSPWSIDVPSSWLQGSCRTWWTNIQTGQDWSCGKTQANPLPTVNKGSGPFQHPSSGSFHRTKLGGMCAGLLQLQTTRKVLTLTQQNYIQ